MTNRAATAVRPEGCETHAGCELSVIVPTFNEQANVAPLLEGLDAALRGASWQAIFVDDNSQDGTAATVKAIARHDSRVSCLRRVGRRGLAGAVIEGALASSATYVAVMDGDGQHDETLLPRMLGLLQSGQYDLVVGSRYLAPGSSRVDGLADPRRRWGSRMANWLGRRLLSVKLTDPVSGFFMIRRELIDEVAAKVAPHGFKILFNIIALQPRPPRCAELGYCFRSRVFGESKLDQGVVAHYLSLLGSKLTHHVISPRAVMFGAVGVSGVAIHLMTQWLLLHAGAPFTLAQALAALTAMTSNYLVNNAVTYRDKRKRGWALATGYVTFCLLCAAGLGANVAVGSIVYEYLPVWWVAAIAGAGVGAGWNYVTTSLAVW